MASRADLYTAAQLQPALYRRYVSLEERIGHTLSPSGVPLSDLTGIPGQRTANPCTGDIKEAANARAAQLGLEIENDPRCELRRRGRRPEDRARCFWSGPPP